MVGEMRHHYGCKLASLLFFLGLALTVLFVCGPTVNAEEIGGTAVEVRHDGTVDASATERDEEEPVPPQLNLEQYPLPSPESAKMYEAGIEMLYGEDESVRNVTGGIELLAKAARLGNAEAMFAMAVAHAYGIGMQRSDIKAVVNLVFAAKSGSVDAMMALAHRHQYGVGVMKSCSTSAKYLREVADRVASTFSTSIHPKVEFIRLDDDSVTHEHQRDDELIQLYIYKSDKGDQAATILLGYAHMMGLRGVKQNGKRAEEYFLKALGQGEGAAAHSALGQLYSQGIADGEDPVKRNIKKAIHHFEQGVAKDHPASHNGMGYLHATGVGVTRDFTTAAKHFQKSAEIGNAEGMYNIGVLYLNGEGVPRDYGKAFTWFKKATQLGSVMAYWQLGTMFYEGIGVPKSCSEALKNWKVVVERGPWHRRVEEAYDAYVAADYTAALLQYLFLAETGLEVAKGNAAFMLNNDLGLDDVKVIRDKRELSAQQAREELSFSLLLVAAEQGGSEAHIKLGDAYYYGRGTEADHKKAVEHYKIAANHNHAQALFNLAYMHNYGLGIEKDLHLAKRFYDLAAEVQPAGRTAVWLALLNMQFGITREEGFGSVIGNYVELPTVLGMQFEDFVLGVLIALVGALALLRHHALA